MELQIQQNHTVKNPVFHLVKPIATIDFYGGAELVKDVSMDIRGLDKIDISLVIDNHIARELGRALIELADKNMEGEVHQEYYDISKDRIDHRINKLSYTITDTGYTDNVDEMIEKLHEKQSESN